uniref:52 kDa repressor of the inhibitor of the protein kinaselike [Bombyx mori] n=1 Tax=Lepeophtheirus salmonis TaxID=72036 RepID=A0A0K2V0L8_LEPSM
MDDINIQHCLKQAFDNAAVMAGHRSGIQARIREVNPNIVFVTCNNHSLNLAAVHAALVVANSVTFLGTLDCLFAFFSASTRRWYILIEITGVTVKRPCETRWSSRSDAVKVIHTKFTEVITALERLMENVENATTRSDAVLIFQVMLSFSFLTFISLWRDTLRDGTQKILQTKGLDLQQCTFKLIISLECFSTSKSRQNSGRCVGIFYRNLL